ncbi:hypothetical protein AAMO2058_000688500 [Amorphochlora amoebiformis]
MFDKYYFANSYVEDAAAAYEKILFEGEIGEIYNVGTEDEVSVLQVTKAIIKAFGIEDEEKWIDFVADRHFNDQRYFISTEKLDKLGWKPQVSFDQGIKKTISWYRNNMDHWAEEDITGALEALEPKNEFLSVTDLSAQQATKLLEKKKLFPSTPFTLI